jgi:UDP-N-acetylenolpyruvoylglucosamine reductase
VESDELLSDLGGIVGLATRPGEPMSKHVPLRVGGPADVWAVAHTFEALRDALKAARRHKVKWRLNWPMQDWVVRDGQLPGLTVRPGRGFEGIERLAPDLLRIHAATPWAAVAGLGEGWWAELARWPGTPGGLFDEGQQRRLKGVCRGVRWFRGRTTDDVTVEESSDPPEIPRTAVLLSVDIGPGLLLFDGVDGPLPPRAGRLFDDPDLGGRRRAVADILVSADIPGSRLRDWRLSREEPGLVVNLGAGTARDLHLLAQGVSARLEKSRGIKLETRISIHGRDRLAARRPIRGRR